MTSTTQGVPRRATVAALVTLAAVLAAVTPSGAIVPLPGTPAFEGNYRVLDARVQGSYVPLPLECAADPSSASILWYAPGPAQDFLWRDLDVDSGSVSARSTTLSVRGIYRPFTGDFDGDGCDDVFWYAPGTPADFVWFGSPSGAFTSVPVTVNGTYRPVVGDFDDDPADDVLWYAPGPARETIWVGSSDRTFTSASAPQVVGIYDPSPIGEGILWFAPGRVQDYVTFVRAGRSTPLHSAPADLSMVAEAVAIGSRTLLYQPGTQPEMLLHRTFFTGALQAFDHWEHDIDGTYRIRSSRSGGVTVLHAPGVATDRIMLSTIQVPT